MNKTKTLSKLALVKMGKKIIFYIIICIFCFSCNTVECIDFPTINLIAAEHKRLTMSSIFETVEYIRLETRDDCLLDNDLKLYVTKHYIITTDIKQNAALLFDRKTGKFIKKIGSRGRGPCEFLSLISSHAFDEKNQILYFDQGNKWIGYQIETEEIFIINKPNLGNNGGQMSVPNFFMLDSIFYYGFVNNFTGNCNIRLVIFDKMGTIYKTFPNYQIFQKSDPNILSWFSGEYYQFNNNFYFKELYYNDTIYKVTRDAICPHIAFFLGNKKPNYFLRESKMRNRDVYDVNLVGECEHYVLFHFYKNGKSCGGYFDKKLNKTFVCENNTHQFINGFINDIDNMLLFFPRSVNQAGEFYGKLDSDEVASFFSKNKKYSLNLNHLSKIKEEDNPVVIIAKAKKK